MPSSSTLQALIEFLQTSYAAQQLAPFVILLGFPALVLLARARWHALSTLVPGPALIQMVLEALGVGFLWNWGNGGVGRKGEGYGEEVKEGKRRKRKLRTRSEQVEVNGLAVGSGEWIVAVGGEGVLALTTCRHGHG